MHLLKRQGGRWDGRWRTRLLFFFFQAEDGIRDVAVTGVQTCALPISDGIGGDRLLRVQTELVRLDVRFGAAPALVHLLGGEEQHEEDQREADAADGEIGRASCRERV